MRPPPLESLRVFETAARTGSFRDAARELGVTPSAVSHRIRSLEDWLRCELFVRSARRVSLTPQGRALQRRTVRALAGLTEAMLRLRNGSGDRLRISALPLITQTLLIPRLAKFEAAHPRVALDIRTSNAVADLSRDPVDIGIRNLTGKVANLAGRKLFDVYPVVLCAPSVAKRLTQPSDLAKETLIDVTARPGGWDSWLAKAGVPGLEPRRRIGFDSIPDALAAAAQGRGVTLALAPLVWASAEADRLRDPFGLRMPSISAYYVVHRKAEARRPAVRAFVEWIAAEALDFRRTFSRERR